jgi:hypothetical protein
MAFIISADNIKRDLPGYDPDHSEKLHSKSAHLADKAYVEAIKNRPESTVILMSGGAASGKTEYISAYLRRKKAIIFDGTLPTFEGAKIKIKNALKHGRRLEIHAVVPVHLETAFVAFLNRDRKFPPEHFFRTHSSSRITLLQTAKTFTNIPIEIIFSENIKQNSDYKMNFTKLLIPDRDFLIDFLSENQYTEDEIKRLQGLT